MKDPHHKSIAAMRQAEIRKQDEVSHGWAGVMSCLECETFHATQNSIAFLKTIPSSCKEMLSCFLTSIISRRAFAMGTTGLLQGPAPPSCTSNSIDFIKAGLPECAELFAIAIESLVTAEEYSAPLAAAE